MDWKQKHKDSKLFRYFGVFAVALAVIVWGLSLLEIEGNELLVSNAQDIGLSVNEVWMYEGALHWWRSIYASVTLPVSVTLLVSGIVAMQFARLVFFVQEVVLKNYPFSFFEKRFSKNRGAE